jgi:hypothetical protein
MSDLRSSTNRIPKSKIQNLKSVIRHPFVRHVLTCALPFFFCVAPVAAELSLPPGFTAQVYVTGKGFDRNGERGNRGIPAVASLVIDQSGALYLTKPAGRFLQGEVQDLVPIYRIPAGGATLTPETESRYFYGPPLKNPQVGAVNANGEVFVTTFDRDRKVGALYRMKHGRALLFAGGTPKPGDPPLLRNPEGTAIDTAGNVYVVDREQGVVVKLDQTGKVLDPQYLRGIGRGRQLAIDRKGRLWVGSDGPLETPLQEGSGQFWLADPQGDLALVLQGPLPAAMSPGPGGTLFVAQRRAGKSFALKSDGSRIEFAKVEGEGLLRALAFAPATAETRQAGIAGDLFMITCPRFNSQVCEVIRVSGPFDELVQSR